MIKLKLLALATAPIHSNSTIIQILDHDRISKFSFIPPEKIVSTIIDRFSTMGKYPFDLGTINGVAIKGALECKAVPRLNPHYLDIKGFGFEWLQGLGLIPPDDITLSLPQDKQDKIIKIKNTHAELLSALTLPDIDIESLKLATMLNMWLFVVDNFFDSKDCEASGNSNLVSSIFNVFIDSFKGLPIEIPIELSTSGRKEISIFSKGIKEIGEKLREIVSDSILIENVLFGLELYRDGNVHEAMEKESSLGDALVSFDEFMTVRNNAGAVDLVFELAYALRNIHIVKEQRDNLSFRKITNLYKGKICYINDIFSCIKESNEKLDNGNYVLITKGSFQELSMMQAIRFVEDQINKISPGINRETQILTRYLGDDLNIAQAISMQEDWDVGHLVWELATANGRHPKNPIIDANDII